MSPGTETDVDADTETASAAPDRYRFEDEDDVDAIDAALRAAATDAATARACAEVAADWLDEDAGRLRVRAFQLELYEPDWPDHVDREQVKAAAASAQTLSEVAKDLRISRRKTKRVLRWAGVIDEVERTTMLSVLKRVRSGDLDQSDSLGDDA